MQTGFVLASVQYRFDVYEKRPLPRNYQETLPGRNIRTFLPNLSL